MSPTATVILAFLSSGTFTVLLTWILKRIDEKKSKKDGMAAQLSRMEKRLDGIEARQIKQEEHDNQQYLSILRLTVMDSDMPMSERLIAGKEYLDRDGNGDVKKFYEDLERRVNTHEKAPA